MSGNLKNEYVFFGGKRIARRDSSGNIFYYFADHLGTITGMQATLIQNAINQSTQAPPPYSIFGPSPACDCGTWAQQMMGAGGVQSGGPAPIPQGLIEQLSQIYGPR